MASFPKHGLADHDFQSHDNMVPAVDEYTANDLTAIVYGGNRQNNVLLAFLSQESLDDAEPRDTYTDAHKVDQHVPSTFTDTTQALSVNVPEWISRTLPAARSNCNAKYAIVGHSRQRATAYPSTGSAGQVTRRYHINKEVRRKSNLKESEVANLRANRLFSS